jgi:hypothetical protein
LHNRWLFFHINQRGIQILAWTLASIDGKQRNRQKEEKTIIKETNKTNQKQTANKKQTNKLEIKCRFGLCECQGF